MSYYTKFGTICNITGTMTINNQNEKVENMNNKEDLTRFSDSELSMRVFNDEVLYRARRNKNYLMDILNHTFIYTSEQLEELKVDLEEDAKES